MGSYASHRAWFVLLCRDDLLGEIIKLSCRILYYYET